MRIRAKDRKGTWPQALIAVFWPVLLLLILRWAVIEPFVIPSGSMIPNLLIHDHVFVKKYSFGLHWPFSDRWMIRWSEPHRGEVVVFRYPDNPSVFYIKRLVGLPGDHVKVVDGHIFVNDVDWTLQHTDEMPPESEEGFQYFKETTDGKTHIVRFLNRIPAPEVSQDWTVPPEHYFFMGDNRDQSSDSRTWGYVPEKNLIGRAWLIWLSCDEMLESAKFVCDPTTLRWSRLFQRAGL